MDCRRCSKRPSFSPTGACGFALRSRSGCREYKNTYAFSIAKVLSRRYIDDKKNVLWVWDNFSLYPGLSGFRGPFSRYTISAADRVYPHNQRGKGYHALWLDGHVTYKELN